MTGTKKITVAVLAIVVIAAAVILCNLPDIQSRMTRDKSPSEDFVEFFTGFYEAPDKETVLDSGGKDVTDDFYDATVRYYEAGDFMSIKDYMWDNGISEVSRSGESLQDL